MYLSYPDLIEESVSDLAQWERAHRGTPLEIRLKMLRLLKAGTFRSGSALAPVLGYSKRQLKRWFDAYREGGLEGLLDRRSPGGSTERVTPEAWADLEQTMIEEEIPHLEDAWRYLAEKHNIQYANVTSISSLSQRRGVKLKTGCKQNHKADREAQAAFKNRLAAAIKDASEEKPDEEDRARVRFFAMDEARFGLKVWHRRRWCPKGHRPPWMVEDRYEWTWLYAAVEPATGESFCLYMPNLDGLCFEVFFQKCREAYPEDKIVLVMDGAGGHRNKSVQWPEGIEGWRLPAYSPELNRWSAGLMSSASRWRTELRDRRSDRGSPH